MFKARWLCICLGTSLFGQTLVDLRTQTKSVDFSGANATKPFKSGTVLPSVCQVGEMFYNTVAAAGLNIFGCTSLNSWTVQSGTLLPSVSGNTGRALVTDGSNLFWSAPGGDISGPLNSVSVTQIQGRPVASFPPGSDSFWAGTPASAAGNQPLLPPAGALPFRV